MSDPEAVPMLKVDDLRASYGPIQALRGVDLEVGTGEIVALIGANGAGKSTLMKALSRLIAATGTARLLGVDGRTIDLLGVEPHRVPALGVGHVPEGRGIFPGLTVRENLWIGAYLRRDRAAIAEDFERQLAQFPRLRERLGQPAWTLSGGEQQMLAIGRALMGRPRLLLLDEPSLGLAPLLVREVFATIARLNRDERLSVLLVEQNARMALKVARRGYVLESGRIVARGPAVVLAANPAVRAAYLGQESGSSD